MVICLLFRLPGPALLSLLLAYNPVSVENLRPDVRVNERTLVQFYSALDLGGQERIFTQSEVANFEHAAAEVFGDSARSTRDRWGPACGLGDIEGWSRF